MTAAITTTQRTAAAPTGAAHGAGGRVARRGGPIRPIPLARLTSVELRKMFDTRSGFWLMASIVIASVLATGVVILFAPDDAITYSTFASAIGFPIAVILPMIAVLSVTSEWSQRSGLTTFTLVPHRGRVLLAKGIATVGVSALAMSVALAVGMAGNVLGANLTGVDTSWDMSVTGLLEFVLGNVIGMLVGFMLGLVIRNSAGAIVGYFVLTLLLPGALAALSAATTWFADVHPWVDINLPQSALLMGDMTGELWVNLGVTSVIWLLLPIAAGAVVALRSEVK